jgi:hypothetical protein
VTIRQWTREPPGDEGWWDIETVEHKLEVSPSTTINGAIVPVVYGTRKVNGLCALISRMGSFMYAMYVFCHGEIENPGGVSNIQINDADIDDIDWVDDYNVHYGTTSQTVDSILTGRTFHSVSAGNAWAEAFPGWCYITLKLRVAWNDGSPTSFPGGGLNVSATIGGRKVYDTRDTTWKYSANCALVAYDIETDAKVPFRAKASSIIPTANWEEWADYCDEVIAGDSSKRFEFNGAIITRDPEAALRSVCEHMHAKVVPYAGKDYLVGDKLPAAITGTWSSSGTTFTEDATSGAATTELAADDVFVCDNQYLIVDTITDDDTFDVVTAPSPAITSEKVRLIRNITIDEGEYSGLPQGRDTEALAQPDVVRVHYHNASIAKADTHDAHDPTVVPPTDAIVIEVAFEGCSTATQAERHGQLIRRLRAFEINTWRVKVRGEEIDLFPGDVLRGSFGDGTSLQPVRVIRRIDNPDDTVTLELKEFDFNAYGDDYAADDTAISYDPGYNYSAPDVPTAASQDFGEHGDWDTQTVLSDPDDITGWTEDSGLGSVFDSPNDWTELELQQTTVGSKTTYLDVTSEIEDFGRFIFHLCMKWEANEDEDVKMTLEYRSGANHGAATLKVGYVTAPPNTGQKWIRPVFEADVTSDAYHEIAIRMENVAVVSAYPKISVRRLRLVPWGEQGATGAYQRPEAGEKRRLGLYERHTWTEHGSAGTSVSWYEAFRSETTGAISFRYGSIAVGHNALEVNVWSGVIGFELGTAAIGIGGSSVFDCGVLMRAVSTVGIALPFPAPTQGWAVDSVTPANVTSVAYEGIIISNSDDYDTTIDLSSWGTTTGFTIADDVASDPGGTTEADRATPDAGPVDGILTRGAREYYSNSYQNLGFVWVKVEVSDGNDEVSFGTSGYSDTGSTRLGLSEKFLRPWWRMVIDSSRFYATGVYRIFGRKVDAYMKFPQSLDHPTILVWECGFFPANAGTTTWAERVTWTAPNYTDDIEAVALEHYTYKTGIGYHWVEDYRVPVLQEEITWGSDPTAQFPPMRTCRDWRLVVVGKSGEKVEFPTPSTSTRILKNDQGRIVDQVDVNTAALGDAKTLVYNSTTKSHDYKTASEFGAASGDPLHILEVYNGTGSTLNKNDLCYISGDQSGTPSVTLADADAESTCKGMLVLINETITNGSSGDAVTYGVQSGFSGLTVGAPQFASTTAGDLTETAPIATGDIIRVVGYAISTTEVFFHPDPTWFEHA